MNYRLLALDMDGTLLTSDKRISEATRDALGRLAAEGTAIAFCTGRCLPELLDYPAEVPFIRYGVLSSGALVYDLERRVQLLVDALDTDAIIAAMALAQEQGAMVHMMSTTVSAARAEDIEDMPRYRMGVYQSMFERLCERVSDPATWAAEHAGQVVKVNFYHEDPEARAITRSKIEAAQLPLTLADAEETSVECSSLGTSKAKGLETLCKHLDISLAEVVAVGDSDNDAEALRVVGMPVAMGNATDLARGLARLVVADNDHDGIAQVVDTLF